MNCQKKSCRNCIVLFVRSIQNKTYPFESSIGTTHLKLPDFLEGYNCFQFVNCWNKKNLNAIDIEVLINLSSFLFIGRI